MSRDLKSRLIRGATGWWCATNFQAARLPDRAVDGTMLTEEAAAALREAGFFTDIRGSNYAVTVLTATSCNLGCAYCYQNVNAAAPGYHNPMRIPAVTLSLASAADIGRFVDEAMTRENCDSSSLLVFGGEPLLNIPGTLDLLSQLKRRNLLDAGIVTNAVLLDAPLATALEDAGLTYVQVTFDGSKAAHDTIRVTRNGRGTYSKILDNVRSSATSTSLKWQFRVNVSHRNIGGLDQLVDDLASVVNEIPGQYSFRLALIDDVGIGYENGIEYSDDLARRFVELNTRAISSGMSVPLIKGLTDCPYCSVVGGGAGAVINADGTLYSCWETVGRPGWEVGSLSKGYITEPDLSGRWVACDYDVKSHGSIEVARKFEDLIDLATLENSYPLAELTPIV